MKNIVIAIDGPVCSGKGTLSVRLAQKLNFLYLYTGGMWRTLTLAAIRRGIDLKNQDEILELLNSIEINLKTVNGETRIFLGDEDTTDRIFDPSVSSQTPIVAAHQKVREEMVRRQRDIVKGKSAVIEGRDIATHVAPDADIKIYLTADVEVRARRRLKQYEEKGIDKNFEEVLRETIDRDKMDSERDASPLFVSSDAIVIDTTNDLIDDTVEKVISVLKEKGLYDTN